MGAKTVTIIITLVLTAILGFGLGIASTVLGAIQPGDCDYEDTMGLDIGQYLLGLGISSIIITTITIGLLGLLLCGIEPVSTKYTLTGVNAIAGLFGTAWFIVGGVILFRGNIDCIRDGSSHVIYALVLWCISTFNLLMHCCGIRTNAYHDDE